MNIKDIYATNDEIRQKLTQTVENLPDEQANLLPEGEKWTIANIVEHIAIVQDGMTRISGKLLAQAQSAGKQSDGAANLSDNFRQKADEIKKLKLEAPDRVRPTGKQTIAASLEKMKETRKSLEEL
ncbi:MAG: DinB family protein, partial [Acidobacteriota bacterium]|nr:DinB family protein [Acidobacteriota bacterium]